MSKSAAMTKRNKASVSTWFQLFSTYYGEDERLNIGPKGFTGEKYGGATYWDTEAYGVPFYLAVTEPEVTRNPVEIPPQPIAWRLSTMPRNKD